MPMNLRSRAVMERLGMVRDVASDFDHPNLPVGHTLRRHLLYRIHREHWMQVADRVIGHPENA